MKSIVLLVSCPDQPGIVARVTDLLFKSGFNVLSLEQHVEEGRLFFMRISAEIVRPKQAADFEKKLDELGRKLKAEMTLRDPRPAKMGILVTKEAAPLYDLLIKQQSGELPGEIETVIGNEAGLRGPAKQFDVPFHHVSGNQNPAEQKMLKLLQGAKVDLVVLARYMKVLSKDFVDAFPDRIINIHHSFLPSFVGAKPYHQAWERGVKVIGATAHYATTELDQGPIIAQDVVPVTHQHSAEMMVEAGRDIERRVLTAAVKAHLEHRVIIHGRRTIVFQP
jgi:formyltetrahydrofolate deformylase